MLVHVYVERAQARANRTLTFFVDLTATGVADNKQFPFNEVIALRRTERSQLEHQLQVETCSLALQILSAVFSCKMSGIIGNTGVVTSSLTSGKMSSP